MGLAVNQRFDEKAIAFAVLTITLSCRPIIRLTAAPTVDSSAIDYAIKPMENVDAKFVLFTQPG